MITVIDYKSGNLKSIENILKFLNCKYKISSFKEDIKTADALIFPGQGHFNQAVINLNKSGLIDEIKLHIEKNKPFLGICLGLQILFEKSEEAPGIVGLGILRGEVKKFISKKIPQIGWNKIITTNNNSFLSDDYFYFVNSYYVVPDDKSIISSFANYGCEFCASIKDGNLIGVQFHPEKSHKCGIAFFKKWIKEYNL